MLMYTLQQEVDALSAEVTRLRLMIYHMSNAKHSLPPASTSSVRADTGRCDNCGVAAPPTTTAVSGGGGGGKSGSGAGESPALDVVLPQLSVALMSAIRDAGLTSSLLPRGDGDDERSERRHRRRRGSQRGTRARKHRHHHHRSSSASSSSTSVSLSSRSESARESKNSKREKKQKKQTHKHAEKKHKHLQPSVNDAQDEPNATAAVPFSGAQENNISQEEGEKLNSKKGKKKTKKEEVASEADEPLSMKERSNTTSVSFQTPQRMDASSPQNTPSMLGNDARSPPASLGASCGMLASILGSFVTLGGSVIPNHTEEQSSSGATGFMQSSKLEYVKSDENNGSPDSVDENGYPFLDHGDFSAGESSASVKKTRMVPLSATTPAPLAEGQEIPGASIREKSRTEFRSLNGPRPLVTQRRTLVDRHSETMDDSDSSSELRFTRNSQQGAEALLHTQSGSSHSAQFNGFGNGSHGNISKNSIAIAPPGVGSFASCGGHGFDIIDEYGTALNDSFRRSENGMVL